MKYQLPSISVLSISRLSFALALFSLPFSVVAMNIFIIIAAIGTIASGRIKNIFRTVRDNRVATTALLLFVYGLITAIYSTGSTADILGDLHKYSKLLVIPFIIPLLDEEWQSRLLDIYLVSVAILLAIVTLKFLHVVGFINRIGATSNPTELFHNHIETSFIISVAAFIAVWRSNEATQYRMLYRLLILWAFAAIFFMNYSRTGYVTALLLGFIYFAQREGRRGIIMGIVLVMAAMISLYFVSPKFRNVLIVSKQSVEHYQPTNYGHDTTSIGLRMDYFLNSVKLIKVRPIFGYGMGSFESEYFNHFGPVPALAPHPRLTNPHNEFMMWFVQGGVIGFILFAGLLLIAFRDSLRGKSASHRIAQGIVVAFAIGSCCDSFLILTAPGFMFVMFAALLFLNRNKSSQTIEQLNSDAIPAI